MSCVSTEDKVGFHIPSFLNGYVSFTRWGIVMKFGCQTQPKAVQCAYGSPCVLPADADDRAFDYLSEPVRVHSAVINEGDRVVGGLSGSMVRDVWMYPCHQGAYLAEVSVNPSEPEQQFLSLWSRYAIGQLQDGGYKPFATVERASLETGTTSSWEHQVFTSTSSDATRLIPKVSRCCPLGETHVDVKVWSNASFTILRRDGSTVFGNSSAGIEPVEHLYSATTRVPCTTALLYLPSSPLRTSDEQASESRTGTPEAASFLSLIVTVVLIFFAQWSQASRRRKRTASAFARDARKSLVLERGIGSIEE